MSDRSGMHGGSAAWTYANQNTRTFNSRGLPGYLELPFSNAVLHALGWQTFGFLGLTCHTILVRELGSSFALIFLFVLAWLSIQKPLSAFVVFLTVVMYQNILISIFSPGMSHDAYTVLSGCSFASVVVLAGVFGGQIRRSDDRQSSQLAKYAAVSVVIASLYLVLGAERAGLVAAAIAFRNATYILFVMIVGLRIGQSWGYRTVATSFLTTGLAGLLLTALEIKDPAWYLDVINATDFNNVKSAGLVTDRYLFDVYGLIDTQATAWLNSPLFSEVFSAGASSFRFGGPNMHGISYAYVLAVAELVLFSLGRWELTLALLPLSVIAGVKGALALFFTSLPLYFLWRVTKSRRALLLAGGVFSLLYVVYGVETGLAIGDPHALGFMGGVNGFLADPLGHGLGAGGNLSQAISREYWQKAQHAGAADVGMESAVGVMLYQMGIGSVAVFAALGALLKAASFGATKKGMPAPPDLLYIGLWMGLLNGFFQEEAYSPYAVGLLALLCGVLVANGRRQQFFSLQNLRAGGVFRDGN